MSDANITTIQEVYSAFGRGDIAAIMAHVSDDLRSFGVASRQPRLPYHVQITKKADVPRFFQALAETVDITRFEPSDFAAAGDIVYATVSFDATFKKSGRTLTHDKGVHRFRLKNGKIVEWFGTEDTAETAAAYNA